MDLGKNQFLLESIWLRLYNYLDNKRSKKRDQRYGFKFGSSEQWTSHQFGKLHLRDIH